MLFLRRNNVMLATSDSAGGEMVSMKPREGMIAASLCRRFHRPQAKAQREPAPASVGKNRVDREKGLAVEPQLDPKANLNLDSAVP